jgi:hypothetical protein
MHQGSQVHRANDIPDNPINKVGFASPDHRSPRRSSVTGVTITLTVRTAPWRAHVAQLANAVDGLVPVVKGNGYGFGRLRWHGWRQSSATRSPSEPSTNSTGCRTISMRWC